MSGAERPRIIVNALPDDYVLVGRIVRKVTEPGYVWPADGIVCLSFGNGDDVRTYRNFGVRKNKTSITVYGPGDPA